MKLLTTCEEIAVEVNRLIPICEKCSVAVAWASVGFETYKLLLKHRQRIARMVVGTEFYQTHPEFLKAFLKQPAVKFLLKTDGVFHPKAYLFDLPHGRWECVVGSPNLTSGGFGCNLEMAVLFSDVDENAGVARTQFLSAMDEYWANAHVLSEGDYEAYAAAWKQKQPAIKRLKGLFGDPTKPTGDGGRSPLDCPKLQMSWDEFVERVRNEQTSKYGHSVDKRVRMIEAIQHLFRSHSHFAEIADEGRRKIAGTIQISDGIDYGYFGNMSVAGRFKGAVNKNSPHLSRALDFIPATGRVTREDYLRFVGEFGRAFPAGGGKTATASRLLAPNGFLPFEC